jgi:hypothetical protein
VSTTFKDPEQSMSEKDDKTSGNVIDIRHRLKGSLNLRSDPGTAHDATAIGDDGVISIEALTFEAKIVQAKAFLKESRFGDAKLLFESALQQSEAIPGIYLRIIRLLLFSGPQKDPFLDELRLLTSELIRDIEITYLRNFSSRELGGFVEYYQLIVQFGFNFGLIERSKNEDLLFGIMQKHRELVFSQDYDEVKILSEEIIGNLAQLGNISST